MDWIACNGCFFETKRNVLHPITYRTSPIITPSVAAAEIAIATAATATATATQAIPKAIPEVVREEIVLSCPHCHGGFIVERIQCGIFRHAILKSNGALVDPHASQAALEQLINQNLLLGCGKPFRYAGGKPEICDYI